MFLRWVVLYVVGVLEENNHFVGDVDELNQKADEMRQNGQLKEADEFVQRKQKSMDSRNLTTGIIMLILLFLIFAIF